MCWFVFRFKSSCVLSNRSSWDIRWCRRNFFLFGLQPHIFLFTSHLLFVHVSNRWMCKSEWDRMHVMIFFSCCSLLENFIHSMWMSVKRTAIFCKRVYLNVECVNVLWQSADCTDRIYWTVWKWGIPHRKGNTLLKFPLTIIYIHCYLSIFMRCFFLSASFHSIRQSIHSIFVLPLLQKFIVLWVLQTVLSGYVLVLLDVKKSLCMCVCV